MINIGRNQVYFAEEQALAQGNIIQQESLSFMR